MEDTIGLASSLGLINRGGAAFGGNVLTRVANKELERDAAKQKAEAARLAKQAKEEEALRAKISAGGKFDELARKDVEKSANDMLMTRGYLDPKRNYEYKLELGRQEEATRERAAAKEAMTKNDYLISPEDRVAIRDHDIAYLEKRAKDPTSGIVANPNLPNVYTLAPEKMIKRLDVNKMMTDIASNVSKDESSYDYSKKSKTTNVNGKNIVIYPVKENILNERANNVLGYGIDGDYQGNPEQAANFIDANKTKIDAVIAANPKITPYEATRKVFIDLLREKTMGGDAYTPSKGITINNAFSSDRGGSFESKKIRLTPVEPTATVKQGEYLYTFVGAKPDVVNLNVGGREDAVKKFNNVTYVGKIDNNKGYVIGTRKMTPADMKSPEGEKYLNDYNDINNYPARVEVPLSVIKGVLQIDEDTWKKMNAVSGGVKPVSKAASKTANTNKVAAPKKGVVIGKKDDKL
jgi:hypothetical protein